ncbi:ribonuclease H, partial [Trifolium pratense]
GDHVYGWLRNGVDGPSKFLFLVAVWWIWRVRNQLCMENEVVSYFTLRMRIDNFAQRLKTCFLQKNISPTTRMVRWNAQGGNGMILNVDGSSIGIPGVSGFGGLIRNSNGGWIQGFARNIGISNILHAELLAMYYGLVLADHPNIKDLLTRDWRVRVVHTLREGNACADYLAKIGAGNPEAYSTITILQME